MQTNLIKQIGSFDVENWPPLRGDYVVGDPKSCIAVVTLASNLRIEGAAIAGPCKTENLGVEKVVANIISNSNIRFLLICGAESKGHLPGDSILALHGNGIDANGRIIGSPGAIPFIQNLSVEAINRFRDQVEILDKIGLENEKQINLLVMQYKDCREPYPMEPFQVIKRRPKRVNFTTDGGDLFLGHGVTMNSSSWLIITRDELVPI
ncbi:MAG: tetrahydromethanopterin S-methyltransferase subunit A [Methanotrichaceae archaeon]|nr:tetrahydromethanopterin S-methyltransferase subunit A [Methanotrichaceae archaeon]